MMSRTDTTYFAKGTDYSAISLPYGDGTVNMYFVMPSSGTSIDSFIKTLDVNKFNEIKQNLQPRSYFSIRIPKYKMEYGTKSLKNILIDLGMADSFGSSANFSGIANGLYVDDVLQGNYRRK